MVIGFRRKEGVHGYRVQEEGFVHGYRVQEKGGCTWLYDSGEGKVYMVIGFRDSTIFMSLESFMSTLLTVYRSFHISGGWNRGVPL